MREQSFRVAVVQMSCSPDPEENLKRACEFIRQAAAEGGQVICLPELFRTQYFCQSEDHSHFAVAEPVPGKTTEVLGTLARELRVVIIAPLFERRAAGLYHNTVAVLNSDGSLVGIYRKMHIPDDPLYYEKFYFTPGDLGFRTFATTYARVAPLICWDQWYPEAARIASLSGAHILCYPTAIGWHPSERIEFGERQHSAWEIIQRAHAIANGVYVAVANRVGHEGPRDGGLEVWGGSFICGPFGEILAKASHEREEVLVAECDPQMQEEVRQHWPFLRDRRIDAYEAITRRFLDE
ncbi:MAG: carbon-nitrogen hydrolase [Candidatus Sumerlaeaceae bacterium]|nr:carbon-nitrogen hydrolase [Candidatus Sumerlaeaceae bacterium]